MFVSCLSGDWWHLLPDAAMKRVISASQSRGKVYQITAFPHSLEGEADVPDKL
jgi:hypothetical protein